MFAFVALLAFAAPFFVRAIVSPLEPAPGDIEYQGSQCVVSWTGDPNSTTLWKGMAIELMTGNNLQMVHLTTVATNQDGTVDGSFSYTCPAVTPNSPIYFYQFSSANAPDKAWTGRFSIVPTGGVPTQALNATAGIAWGTGSLADPSTAVAAPSFDDSDAATLSSPTSNLSLSVSSAISSTTGAATIITNTVTSSGSVPSSTNSANATSQSTQSASGASGAISGFDVRVWGAVAAATLALLSVW